MFVVLEVLERGNSLFQWLNNQEIDIILLQETFFTKEMEFKIQQEWKGKCFHSYGTNHSRGVSILIKTNIDIVVESYFTSKEGRNVMTNLILDDRKICVVNVYAPTEKPHKDGYFKYLEKWITSKKVNSFPELIIGGDFNCVLNPRIDTVGTKSVYVKPIALQNIISAFNLIDIWREMHTECLQFTCKNDRHHMASRLDFWLINLEFRQYVSKTHIKPMAICPDHCAILMVTNLSDIRGDQDTGN